MSRPSRRRQPVRATTSTRLNVTHLEDRSTPALIGALDPSFAANGVFTESFGAGIDRFTAVAPSGDGGYIAVGTNGPDQIVVKLTAGGVVDENFGTGGVTPISFRADTTLDEVAQAVVVLPDGSIIVGGYFEFAVGDEDASIAKLSATGAVLDTEIVSGDGGAFDERVNGLTVSGTNVYAVGTDGADFLLRRYDFALTPVSGAVKRDLGNSADSAFGVVVNSTTGAVYAAGFGGAAGDFAVARFTESLIFSDLKLYSVSGGIDGATGIVIQPQTGRYYLGGIADAGGTPDFAAIEIDSTTLNQVGGSFVRNLAGEDGASQIVAGQQGRVYLVGVAGSTQAAIVRLTSELALDTNFNGTGIFLRESGLDSDNRVGATVDAQGRVVGVAGADGFAAAIRVTGQTGQPGGLLLGGPTAGVVVKDAVNSTFNGYAPAEAPIDVLGANVVVRTAQADVNGDGVLDDIVGAGPGSDLVRVFSGSDGALLNEFPAFGGSTAGVYVAGADFDEDGKAEVIVGAGQNNGTFGARVRVFRGASVLTNFGSPALMADFAALADANDGIADVTPGTLAIVGANVAVGDVNGDGIPDLVVGATGGGGPRATIWDGINIAGANGGTPALPPLANAFVFEESQRGGVWVTLGDVTGDGLADLIGGGGPTGGPRVRIGDMAQILAAKNFGFFDDTPGVSRSNFFVRNDFETYRAGIRVTARDIDGDNIADLVVGSGDGFPADVGFYLGTRLTTFTSGFQAPDGNIDTGFGGGVLTNGVFVG